jgi:hypothetical protein
VGKLLGFDFTVEYKPGHQNIVDDALSRRDVPTGHAYALTVTSFDLFEADACNVPGTTGVWRVGAALGTRRCIFTFQRRAYVLPASQLVAEVLSVAHDVGHEGIQKSLHRLCRDFHLPQARSSLQQYIRVCPVCQRNKTEQLHPAGMFPSRVWEDIFMDFIEALPKVGGKSVILTVVDRLSKYALFIPLAHPYTAESIAKAFSNIVRLHGFPTFIVSDRDVVFNSEFWKALFAAAGTRLHMSSAFHPQMANRRQ